MANLFDLGKAGAGYYHLLSASSTQSNMQCLDSGVFGVSGAAGKYTCGVGQGQYFKYTYNDDGTYQVKNRAGFCLDSTPTAWTFTTCDPSSQGQQFNPVVTVNSSGNPFYRFQSMKTGTCLSVSVSGATSNGSYTQNDKCSTTDPNQHFVPVAF